MCVGLNDLVSTFVADPLFQGVMVFAVRVTDEVPRRERLGAEIVNEDVRCIVEESASELDIDGIEEIDSLFP